MATYTININEKTQEGKKLIEFLKSLTKVVTIQPKKINGLDEAILDLKDGRVKKAKNTKDLIKKILG